MEIMVAPHTAIAAKCSHSLKAAPGYDRLPQRSWLFVPLWGIATCFLCAAQRVQCPEHGVVIEHVPWSHGKRPVTIAMMCFLCSGVSAGCAGGPAAILFYRMLIRCSSANRGRHLRFCPYLCLGQIIAFTIIRSFMFVDHKREDSWNCFSLFIANLNNSQTSSFLTQIQCLPFLSNKNEDEGWRALR
jgi:hypothetical protein